MERISIAFYFDLITNFLEFFTYIKYSNYKFSHEIKNKTFIRNYIIYMLVLFQISLFAVPHIWLVMTCCSFVFNWLTYKINIKSNVLHLLKYHLLYFVPFFILFFLSVLLFDNAIAIENYFYQYLKVVVICTLLYICFSFLCNNKERDRHIVNPYNKYIFPFIISILTILCTLVFISINLDAKKGTFQNIIVITFLVNIIMILLIISIYEKIVAFLQDAALKQLKLQQYEMNQSFYDDLSNKTKQLGALKHDFKNHLTIIHGWLYQEKYTELDTYLNSLQDYVITSSDVIITKNQTISSILQAKKSKCERKEILFICEIDFDTIYKITDMDFIILLGNILDNAIEAVDKIKDDHRQIYLSIKQSKSYLNITCINPIVEIPIEKHGILQTTKTDNGIHGIGLSNVIDTCKKYNGECSYNYDDKEFQIKLLLPNY